MRANMDITEITETEPKRLFVEIDKNIRPEITNFTLHGTVQRMKAYFQTLTHAAKRLDIEFAVNWPEEIDATASGADLFQLYQVIAAEVNKRKVDILIDDRGVALDTAWREKIHTYVSHIRLIVNGAENLSVQIRDRILAKLHAFDAELDRSRTRIQVLSDAFVSLCEGLSAGAEALGPAMKLCERAIGALARLREEPPVLALPPPEQLDLPAPDTLEKLPDN
jgi:hypothetical protein